MYSLDWALQIQNEGNDGDIDDLDLFLQYKLT